eukprot:COSAG03_NODE_982_length_5115_cov_9.263357_3_plen_229_part_00
MRRRSVSRKRERQWWKRQESTRLLSGTDLGAQACQPAAAKSLGRALHSQTRSLHLRATLSTVGFLKDFLASESGCAPLARARPLTSFAHERILDTCTKVYHPRCLVFVSLSLHSEVFASRDNCGPGGTIEVHDAATWQHNVAALAWAAQNSVPAWPIIFQAGCKSPTLEYQTDSVRYALELSGYASFLLAVEPNATRPIHFGTNAFWRKNGDPEVKPFAALHPVRMQP